MKVQRLFQKTLFGIFLLFGIIGISTTMLCIYTVDTHLSEEYEANAGGIAKTIADASVDIILNRDLSTLQSLIDQFVEIPGIGYIYITNDAGEFLAHTFVPGIPSSILEDSGSESDSVERSLPGLGDFLEVSSPILAGVVGEVHLGMDTGRIALKIQNAIGQQIYLFSIIFVFGIVAAIRLVHFASGPIASLLDFAVDTARNGKAPENDAVLDRSDEAGHLARLFKHLSDTWMGETRVRPASSEA